MVLGIGGDWAMIGGTSAHIKEVPERSLTPSTKGEVLAVNQKESLCQNTSMVNVLMWHVNTWRLHLEVLQFCYLDIGLPASIAVRNKPVVYKLPSLWYVGFPGGDGGKELICQCRRRKRCGFSPWVGKIPWRRAWQPTPGFLPGESHRQRSPVGCSPWGRKSHTWLKQLSMNACLSLLL